MPESLLALLACHRRAMSAALLHPPTALDLRLLRPHATDATPLLSAANDVLLVRAAEAEQVGAREPWLGGTVPWSAVPASAQVDAIVAAVGGLAAPVGPYPRSALVVGTASRQGPLGATMLNRLLQPALNRGGAPTPFADADGLPIRLTDPLTALSNLYDARVYSGERLVVIGTSRDETGAVTLLALRAAGPPPATTATLAVELTGADAGWCALGYADTIMHVHGDGHAAGVALRLSAAPALVLLALDAPG